MVSRFPTPPSFRQPQNWYPTFTVPKIPSFRYTARFQLVFYSGESDGWKELPCRGLFDPMLPTWLFHSSSCSWRGGWWRVGALRARSRIAILMPSLVCGRFWRWLRVLGDSRMRFEVGDGFDEYGLRMRYSFDWMCVWDEVFEVWSALWLVVEAVHGWEFWWVTQFVAIRMDSKLIWWEYRLRRFRWCTLISDKGWSFPGYDFSIPSRNC